MNNNLFIESNLPDTLSEKELLSYFEKMHNGDEDAREIIIKHNLRLVINRVTKKFSLFPYEKQDLVSIGMIGLINSVDTFDITKNLKFSTYAAKCIDNGILNELKSNNKKLKQEKSINSKVTTDKNGNELTLEDISSESIDFTEDYEKQEIIKVLIQLIDKLEGRKKEELILYFYKGYNEEQIAAYYNITKKAVSQMLRSTLQDIANELKEQGLIENYSIRLRFKDRKNYNNIEL